MGLNKEGGAVIAATSVIFILGFFFVLSYNLSIIVLLSASQRIPDILASLLDSGKTKDHVVHPYLCQF